MALRCLIVDDSPHFLTAARALLERDGFARVEAASTIAEALLEVRQGSPDLVLVDVDLGNESGLDLVRQIDRETNLDPSRVILISSYGEEDLAELVRTAPAAGFLSKSRLSQVAIRRILEHPGSARTRPATR